MTEGPPMILVVDDEESFTDALGVTLEREGFRATFAADGVEALARFHDDDPDLILLDVMLPRMSGLDVCRAIRSESKVPIIMVSARSEELDTVVGLEVGADDYIAKPYKTRELVARIRAALRRSAAKQEVAGVDSFTLGRVVILPERHEVRRDGKVVELTRKEFDLLFMLAENSGRVVSREQILDRVWGYDYVGDTKTLDVHIRRLRSKLEPDVDGPTLIRTIRGVGYMLDPTSEPA